MSTTAQGIADATQAYNDFDDLIKYQDEQNFVAKINKWKADVDGKHMDPSVLLMLFFTMIMVGGNTPNEGLAGDGSSLTHNKENQLTEVSKELNYASAFRNAIAEMKNQLVHPVESTDPTKDSVKIIEADLAAIQKYTKADAFGPHADPIFQNSEGTFAQAETDITTILGKIPGTYPDLQALITAAQTKPVDGAPPNDAANDFQKLSNACDTLFSAVGVQQNVLGTQMQDIESDYKSLLSTDTQAVKSVFSLLDYILQKMISN